MFKVMKAKTGARYEIGSFGSQAQYFFLPTHCVPLFDTAKCTGLLTKWRPVRLFKDFL